MIPRAHLYFPPTSDTPGSPSGDAQHDLNRPAQATAMGFVIPFRPREANVNSREKRITFQSAVMKELVQLASQYAASSASVMITGESGTGKELFSRLIHEHSARADQPFLAVNCAAVPEPLMESEVFGHERGAFTGAIQKRSGYFERAHGGTLLLDEITEIPITLQAKLLRVLEEQEVQPVGSDQPRQIDVRIVATSNRDLKTEVARGTFRADLFHRLNVLDLKIPPLRERVTDIPLLVQHFVELFEHESPAGIRTVTAKAMHVLCAYAWPGNVRELRNVMHRACIIASDGEINEAVLPDLKAETKQSVDSLEGVSLAEVERKVILACLQKFGGNKKSAALELGVTARTLSNKLKQYQEQGFPQTLEDSPTIR